MKNKIAVLVKVMVLAAILVLLSYLTYSSLESSPADKKKVEIEEQEKQYEAVQPELEMLQNSGVAVLLDYEGEDRIIFHGEFGLFIYDMKENKMMGMLDLAPLGCDKVQGPECCDVRVTEDGEEVYLIRMEDNVYVETYIYQWRENELFRIDYNENILKKEFYDYKENKGILEEGSSIGEICYKIAGKEVWVFDDF